MKVQFLRKTMCATCPFRVGSPHANLIPCLEVSALTSASRICHSTGSGNALYPKPTGKPAALCRGARNRQLAMFAGMGFISEPTDAAWAAKCREMGLKEPKLL